jgi:hypothetical protein
VGHKTSKHRNKPIVLDGFLTDPHNFAVVSNGFELDMTPEMNDLSLAYFKFNSFIFQHFCFEIT